MPLTSALTMALPSAGLPPQVQVMFWLTLSSAAISSTVAVNALSTSPVTEICHSSGLTSAKSVVALHSAAVAPRNVLAMVALGVVVAWSQANVPSRASAFTTTVASVWVASACMPATSPVGSAAFGTSAARADAAPPSAREAAAMLPNAMRL